MPELPEVQTVRDGLAPVMEGYIFDQVTLNRPDLRFPFDPDFISRIESATLTRLSRRAKFLMASLSTGDTLLMHLGMSGRFSIQSPDEGLDENGASETAQQGRFVHANAPNTKHDHVIFKMSNGAVITFNDPRRFGFMELFAPGPIKRLELLGPEPLSNQFSGPALKSAMKGKKTPIKNALLDQHIVAGLGNIYVCEALFRARISPRALSGSLSAARTETLSLHIKEVIRDAIAAGGSSLKDFASADGNLGYFQHSFDVYGREGDPCRHCEKDIKRLVQGGRSTFYCAACQKH